MLELAYLLRVKVNKPGKRKLHSPVKYLHYSHLRMVRAHERRHVSWLTNHFFSTVLS